jgi:hypothetical protein
MIFKIMALVAAAIPIFLFVPSNEEQKDRDSQVSLLLEFRKAVVDPCRSSKKD